MNKIDKIKNLIKYLPSKDISIGEKFYHNRDFQSLQELIDSAIYKIEKNNEKETPNPQLLNLDMESLVLLKTEVDNIVIQLSIEDNEENNKEIDDGEY